MDWNDFAEEMNERYKMKSEFVVGAQMAKWHKAIFLLLVKSRATSTNENWILAYRKQNSHFKNCVRVKERFSFPLGSRFLGFRFVPCCSSIWVLRSDINLYIHIYRLDYMWKTKISWIKWVEHEIAFKFWITRNIVLCSSIFTRKIRADTQVAPHLSLSLSFSLILSLPCNRSLLCLVLYIWSILKRTAA